MEALKIAEAYCLRPMASAVGTGQENVPRPAGRRRYLSSWIHLRTSAAGSSACVNAVTAAIW
ncbi:MAG: hypothetical protein IKS67_00715, partial [Victivallales bacterium]|nr:hypothetical protein [Victivallales bacterium]